MFKLPPLKTTSVFSSITPGQQFIKLLKDEFPEPGSAKNRKNNAPESGKTTLMEIKNA